MKQITAEDVVSLLPERTGAGMVVCKKCNGTGIESYFNHGHGEDSVEPIKCDECDGFGR